MAMIRVVLGRKEILTRFDLRAVTLWINVEFSIDHHNHSQKLPHKCFTEKNSKMCLKMNLPK